VETLRKWVISMRRELFWNAKRKSNPQGGKWQTSAPDVETADESERQSP